MRRLIMEKSTQSKLNAAINKLTAYAADELMLDQFDVTYTTNRLAALVGITPAPAEADYGDGDLNSLIDELTALAPVDRAAVTDIVLPLPHTVNYYFTDELGRNRDKAFDFLFELYAAKGDALGKSYIAYANSGNGVGRSAVLNVGSDDLEYTPVTVADKIARLECPDFMSEDIAAREAAFAEKYGGIIAKRIGDEGEYLCARSAAITSAKVKSKIADGVVKISELDYPAAAISVSGAKNAAVREAARIIKAAADENIPCVCACSFGEWVTFYIIFANDVETSEYIKASDALFFTGVYETIDMSPIVPVLKKGTALSTDLFAFKSLYAKIGGVKHGEKAEAALGDALAEEFKKLLAAASVDKDKVVALATPKQN